MVRTMQHAISSDFDWRAYVLFKWQANWKTEYGTEVFYYGHIVVSEFPLLLVVPERNVFHYCCKLEDFIP